MGCISGIAKLPHCIPSFIKPAVSIYWNLRDPRVVLYGSTNAHDATVVAGQIKIDVNTEFVEVDNFSATLSIHIVQKRPFQESCASCRSQRIKLRNWNFVDSAKVLQHGQHAFPFSFSLDGSHPTSIDENDLVSICYEFSSVAHINRCCGHSSFSESCIKFERLIKVQRNIPEPDLPFQLDHNFPPSEFRTEAQLNRIVYPGKPNCLYLRLQGPATKDQNPRGTNEMWKLRRVAWRLEETVNVTVLACAKHAVECPGHEREGRVHTNTRVIDKQDLYEGWKSSLIRTEGMAEMEIEFGKGLGQVNSRKPRYNCDLGAWEGISVVHTLVVEFAVCWENNSRYESCISSGNMLGMRYPVVLADYADMEVSSGDDAPPRYEDVSPEPPSYAGA